MAVNKVILIGNVGKDPDVKYFDNGSAVANFTLATTERGYTAANGTQIPGKFVLVLTMMQMVLNDMLVRFMPIIWSC